MAFKIYIISNGYKNYIGVTSQSLQQRWHQHKSSHNKTTLGKAIAAQGSTSFTISTIWECESRSEAADKEKELINYYNTAYPNGYNISLGGYPTRDFERNQPESQQPLHPLSPFNFLKNLDKARLCWVRISFQDGSKRSFMNKFPAKRKAMEFVREQLEHSPHATRGEVLEQSEVIAIIDKQIASTYVLPNGMVVPPRRDLAWRTIQEMRTHNKEHIEEHKEYQRLLDQNS
jgi:predicted GIY-YIG superfamily endonuclease